MTRHRRRGRALTVVLVGVACLALGGAIGWYAAYVSSGPSSGPAGNSGAEGDVAQLYTCGMHPTVIEKQPGDCPICHMKLTPVKAGAETDVDAGLERKVIYWRSPVLADFVSDRPGQDPRGMNLVPVYAPEGEVSAGPTVRIDPVVVQNMGVRTVLVRRGSLRTTLRTVGRVDYNEQAVAYVNTKFDGWIERLHVDQTGAPVERGDALFDVYAPRLYSAQEEYVAALRGVERLAGSPMPEALAEARRLADSARVQLRYLDVSDAQIAELEHTKEIRKTMTIFSPSRGIVTEKSVLEGAYITPDARLYTIADLSKVWVYVDVYEYQLPWVRVGQEARMSLPYVPDREFVGHVVYVYPYLETQTRVIKVRLEFDNPTLELKPGMYAGVTLHVDLGREALVIPREAYIDSGRRNVAFVDAGGGKFKPREVQLGVDLEDGQVEVVFGLDEGERVVTSGQFLLDTESRLKEAIAKASAPSNDAAAEATPRPVPSSGHGH
ncbi:MAG: efflux RND transporter periplasmic adaptor subunit [Phycisphaerae bacterium]|nr:MAG: efflux RND transporter periplasmic adaptor subunit [Phycisphaerae bacterium]MBE7457038.1 efflux RND transporter periplasmic adaptor subunit [Planctomycetia bacterium]MCL4718272.1 efflux RND transporter periplasmic adaptor subunit [Phycisphaerae bacterium]